MDANRLRTTAEKVVKDFHSNIHLLIFGEVNSEAQFLDRLRHLLKAKSEQKPEIMRYLLQPQNFDHYGHLLYRKFANLERDSSEFEDALADLGWQASSSSSSSSSSTTTRSKNTELSVRGDDQTAIDAITAEERALAEVRISIKSSAPGKLRDLAKQFEQGQIKNASQAKQVDTSADEALARGLSDAWRRRESDSEARANEVLIAKLNSENVNYLEAKRIEEASAGLDEALAAKILADEQTAAERARLEEAQASALAKKLQAEEEARARAIAQNRYNAEQQGFAAALRLMAEAEEEVKISKQREQETDALAIRLQVEEDQHIRQNAARRRQAEKDAELATQLVHKDHRLALTRNQSLEQDALLAAEILRNEEQALLNGRAQADRRNAQMQREDEERARKSFYQQQTDQDEYRSYLRTAVDRNNIDRNTLSRLADMRRQLNVSEEAHFLFLEEMGVSRDRFAQIIKNGQAFSVTSYSSSLNASQPRNDTWTVLTPLRVRTAPFTTAEEICQLNVGQKLVGQNQQGNWLQHDLGWSMIHTDPSRSGEVKYFLSKDQPVVSRDVKRPDLYEVLMPLRVRENPSPNAPEVLILEVGSVVKCLEIRGFWLRHDLGWSMIHSDPSKGVVKYFLNFKSAGDGRVG